MVKEAREDQQLRIISRGSPLHHLEDTGKAAAIEERPTVSNATAAAAAGITLEVSTPTVSTEVEQLETTVSATIGTCHTHLFLYLFWIPS